MKTIRGTVHGRSIELAVEPGLSDGMRVEVVITPISDQDGANQGIRRSAGAWADDAAIDFVMDRLAGDRKRERSEP